MTEKQVLFESRVDIVSTMPNWATPTTYDLDDPSSVPSSGELGWPLVSLAKVSSIGYSKFGLQHSSTHRGASNYNYGYSAVERPDKLGLLSFSSEDLGNHDGGCSSSCQWVHDPLRRWIVACWACITLLSLLILAALAMILVFCIIIPKRPYLEVPEQVILVQALNVTSIAPPPQQPTSSLPAGQMTARFSAHFKLQFDVKNPNRVHTDYTESRFSVAYGDTVVGESTMAAFSLKAHASQRKRLVLMADVEVSQPNAVSLLSDANVHDNISLLVRGRVQGRLVILGIVTPPVLIKIWCNVKVSVKELEVTDQQCHLSKHKVIWCMKDLVGEFHAKKLGKLSYN